MILILFSLEAQFCLYWKLKSSSFDFVGIYLEEDLLADWLALDFKLHLTDLILLVDYLRALKNAVDFCLLYFVPVEDWRMGWGCWLRPKKGLMMVDLTMFDENGKAGHSLQKKGVADMMMNFGGSFLVVGNKRMVHDRGQAHFFDRDDLS